MNISGLSEKELNQILEVLEGTNVRHSVHLDEEVLDANKTSLRNDLRHLFGADISTDILRIEINDNDLDNASEDLKEKLSKFVYLGAAPEGVEISNEQFSHAKSMRDIVEKQKTKSLGISQVIQIFIAGALAALFLLNYLPKG